MTNYPNLGFKYDLERIQSLPQPLGSPDFARALFVAEKMRVDYVYNTTALEGNPYTYPEVKTLIEGITVGGHKVSDTQQVLNLNKALSHVIGLVKVNAFKLDKPTACGIQAFVAQEEALEWGVFRTSQVYIGGTDYIPPPANELDGLFDLGIIELNKEHNPFIKAWLTFLWGSLSQFFYDGNKRTSRLLANGFLLSAGYPPLMLLAKDQLQYNQIMTDFYGSQNGTDAIIWLHSYYQERVHGLGFDAQKDTP